MHYYYSNTDVIHSVIFTQLENITIGCVHMICFFFTIKISKFIITFREEILVDVIRNNFFP